MGHEVSLGKSWLLCITATAFSAFLIIVTRGGTPDDPPLSKPAEADRPVIRILELNRATPRSRNQLAQNLKAQGKPIGKTVMAGYPKLKIVGKIHALRLIYDHDRPALNGKWKMFLTDLRSPGVVAVALDLVKEMGGSDQLAILRNSRPERPKWLVNKWLSTRGTLDQLLARRDR